MGTSDLAEANRVARDFLTQFSPHKPPLYADSTRIDEGSIVKSLREALAEAQSVLLHTATSALERKAAVLNGARKRQRYINMAHFVTGSGFVALIALGNPDFVKWFGALVALISGLVAFTLPGNLSELEKAINHDVAISSALAGEISELQIEFARFGGLSPPLIKRATKSISACHRLATKYELDKLVGYFGNNIHNMSDKDVLKGIVGDSA